MAASEFQFEWGFEPDGKRTEREIKENIERAFWYYVLTLHRNGAQPELFLHHGPNYAEKSLVSPDGSIRGFAQRFSSFELNHINWLTGYGNRSVF
jgi:hypothetical protein